MGYRDFKRSDRVSAHLRRVLAKAIHQKLPDEDTSYITISDVEVSRDLSIATAYINTLHPEQKDIALKTLNLNVKLLRKVMAQELSSVKVPELRFKYDASLEYGKQMESLIRKARSSDPGLLEDND